MPSQFIQTIYNEVAASYDTTALVQAHIGKDFLNELDFIAMKPKKILDLGCATGYLTQALQERYPDAEVLGIDVAENMIKLAKVQYPACQFLQKDFMEAGFPEGSLDLIFANCFWYCLEDVPSFLDNCYRCLSPNGLFMFSTYGPDTWSELHIPERSQHLYDMHNIGDAVLRHGFSDPVVTTKRLPVKFESAEQACLSLLHNGDAAMCFVDPNNIHVEGNDPIKVTYEIVLGHAWKTEVKKNYNEEKSVLISSIRKRS